MPRIDRLACPLPCPRRGKIAELEPLIVSALRIPRPASTGGQTGAVSSLFIRGTKTADSQVVIDGMRLSDSSTPLGNVLSGGRVNEVGSIEILRGPQGAI